VVGDALWYRVTLYMTLSSGAKEVGVTSQLIDEPATEEGGIGSIGARSSLRDEVVRILQAAIVAGDLRPGITYSAPQLAQQLGVSATPVREAMLQLVNDGLITTVRNKGFRVIELSDRELDEITELRRLIEVPTVGAIAARGIPKAVMTRLRGLAGRIEEAAQARDFIAHNRLDIEFHALLLAQAGNANLVELVTSLRTRSRLYGAAELADREELAPMLHEHTLLLDHLEAGDAAAATAVMAEHLDHVRREWATQRGNSHEDGAAS
jgi:DNA-binding GntR family transcriptional regulator